MEAEALVGGEWAEWYRLAPLERWRESEKLWQIYLALGGSLDSEPDTQSPFFDARAFQNRQRIKDVPKKKFIRSRTGEKISLV
jgi:hypothetical protein